MLDEVSAHWPVGHDAVEDPPAFTPRDHVSSLTQVAKDQRHASLAEMKPVSHVAHPQTGLTLDREEQPPMVREE